MGAGRAEPVHPGQAVCWGLCRGLSEGPADLSLPAQGSSRGQGLPVTASTLITGPGPLLAPQPVSGPSRPPQALWGLSVVTPSQSPRRWKLRGDSLTPSSWSQHVAPCLQEVSSTSACL